VEKIVIQSRISLRGISKLPAMLFNLIYKNRSTCLECILHKATQ